MFTALTHEDVYSNAIEACKGLSPSSREYAHVMEVSEKRLRSLPGQPALDRSPLALQYDELLAAWPGLCESALPRRVYASVAQETVQDVRNMLEWRPGVQPGLFNFPQGAAGKRMFKDKYAGHTDWRLPTIQEALTLVDYERTNPACNVEIAFGRTLCIWTATHEFPRSSGRVWVIDMRSGESFTQQREFAAELLLVRTLRDIDIPSKARR